MTSPVATAMDNLETTLEALTPPDRTTSNYRHVDGFETAAGSSGDRQFWFAELSMGAPVAERGGALTIYEHTISLKLKLVNDGYLARDRGKRVVNEAVLLVRAIDKAADGTWGTGVIEVITRGYSTEKTRSNEVIVTFPLTVSTEESD